MKRAGYLLFALFFNIFRIVPIQRRKILLYNGHNKGLTGNLLAIRQEFERHEENMKFIYFGKQEQEFSGKFAKIRKFFSLFVILPYHMATAGRCFFNDNFLPLGYCRTSAKSQFVQLWHGAGAFKKFGLSTEQDRKVRQQVIRSNERMTHLFVTSKQVIPFYSEAFGGIPYEKIFATGIPITDIYFQEEEKKAGQARFYNRYPDLREKKLLLVTPTFRNSQEENDQILKQLPEKEMREALGENWVILLRMHPKYPAKGMVESSCYRNMTDYPDVSDLYFVSDILMTDYSSTVVEYVLLDKPMVFYAYDLEKYDRGFYRDYESTVPGPVAHSLEEMLEILSGEHREEEARENFRKMQYDYLDDRAAERIWKVLERRR